MLNPRLFGTDGIRAIAGKPPLDEATLPQILWATVRAFTKHYPVRQIFLAQDTRESSAWITQIASTIFQQAGYQVYPTGVLPTPGMALLCQTHQALGMVVTASHNPYEFNGIKFFAPGGEKITDELEQEIQTFFENAEQSSPLPASGGSLVDYTQQAEEEYCIFLKKAFTSFIFSGKLTIDCANGSTYKSAQQLFAELFPQAKFIGIEPNGRNINDRCGATSLGTLQSHITPGEIGIAFDGDGDRVMFVDEQGMVRDGDFILALLAREYQRQGTLKNNIVATTVMANLGLIKYLESLGIQTVLTPVGDIPVYRALVEKNGILGGEQSGHIILREHLPMGNGMLVALQVLEIMSRRKKTLHELCNVFQKYPQILKNVAVAEKPALENIFPAALVREYEQKLEGRIVLRYSGTEPLLRIMIEGRQQAEIQQAAEELTQHFLRHIGK